MNALPEHLRQAARIRSEEAEARARTALNRLTKAKRPIGFTAVAREAAVSTDFLYRHSELRALIESHRERSDAATIRDRPDQPVDTSTSAAVRALSTRLAQQQKAHREEVTRLRRALEVAHGENLELRRRLTRFVDSTGWTDHSDGQ